MTSPIESIEFHGLPALRLTARSGAVAIVSLFGAQVLSWRPDGKTERLYLSEQADFRGDGPIRGGVPVVFPQFAALGKLPRHGLLRTRRWQVEQQRCEEAFAMATFVFSADDDTLALWPYLFDAELTVLLEDSRLDIELEIHNSGHAPFAFTAALHTYLRVAETERIRLVGLQGHAFQQADDKRSYRDDNEVLTIEDEIDRLYHDVAHPVVLVDGGREMRIQNHGFADLVVWNPWERNSPADMALGDFRRMLCVEAAAARNRIALDAGDSWVGRQTLLAA